MLKELNDLQNSINQVINRIMKDNLDLRKRRRKNRPDFSKELKIFEITEDIILFEMGKNKYENHLENRELFIEGRYKDSENIYFELTFGKKDEYISYKVGMDLKNRKAYCKFLLRECTRNTKNLEYDIDLD